MQSLQTVVEQQGYIWDFSVRFSSNLGKTVMMQKIEIPRNGTIKVQMHFETQLPHFELSLMDKKTNKPFTASIHTRHISYATGDDPVRLIGFNFDHDKLKEEFAVPDKNQDSFKEMASNIYEQKKQTVVRFRLGLRATKSGKKNLLDWDADTLKRLREIQVACAPLAPEDKDCAT